MMLRLVERVLILSLSVAVLAWILRRAGTRVGFLPELSVKPLSATATAQRPEQHEAAWQTLCTSAIAIIKANTTALELQKLFGWVPEASRRKLLANYVEENGSGAQTTALHYATSMMNAALCQVLLTHGANVTAGRLDEGTTPLHVASGWRHSEAVVDVLLGSPDRVAVADSLRAKPTTGGLRHHTPVFWAAHYGHMRTRQKLIQWMREEGWRYRARQDSFEEAFEEERVGAPRADEEGAESEPSEEAEATMGATTIERTMSAAEAIAALDTLSTGEVGLAEVATLLRLAGANPTDAEVVLYRTWLREQGAHAVTVEHLEALLRLHAAEHPPEEELAGIESAWEVVDQDGDGAVRGAEMQALATMLTTLGEPLSDDELEEFLGAVDADGDGELSKGEFMHAVAPRYRNGRSGHARGTGHSTQIAFARVGVYLPELGGI